MINVTPDPVKIFYDLEAENHLMMDVRDSEGEVVPEIIQEKGDYGGLNKGLRAISFRRRTPLPRGGEILDET